MRIDRVLLLTLAVALACDSGDDAGDDLMMADEGSGGADMIDEAMVLADAMAYATDLERVSNEPRESSHSVADTVQFYVQSEIKDLYLSIDPDAGGDATFSEGALIVKENLDADGNPDGFFAMYKGFAGYDPEGNDWYWLRVGGAGATADSGKVGFCKSCHGGATSDFIWGVPADNRL